MEERVYTGRRGPSAVAWIALILSILALALAWTAFNRTGEDLEDKIQQQVEQGLNATEDATRDAGDALDAGPDGVDEDDTDVPSGTTQTPTTMPEEPTTNTQP